MKAEPKHPIKRCLDSTVPIAAAVTATCAGCVASSLLQLMKLSHFLRLRGVSKTRAADACETRALHWRKK